MSASPPLALRPADPDAPEVLACLSAYAAFLKQYLPEEGPDPVPLPMPDAEDYRPPRGVILLALSGNAPLGCVALHRLAPGLGEVKRLWVMPQARGQGLARRLMQAIEDEARALGLTRLNLDTHERLTGAIALYRKTGWTDAPPYSGYPATHWFTKPL